MPSAISPRLWDDPMSVILLWTLMVLIGFGIGWILGFIYELVA